MTSRSLNVELILVFCLFSLVCCRAWAEDAIELNAFSSGMVGKHVSYFQEDSQPLTLKQALLRFDTQEIEESSADAISLGLGVRPVWLRATINNDNYQAGEYRVSVETPWLDYIDAYLVHDGQVMEHIAGGDALPFDERPMPYRYFAFETRFPKGVSSLYFRVQSAGPMAIPIHISPVADAIQRDIKQGYEYGILYGILLALAVYNLVLYLLIRQPEFGLYSGYLFGFVANSLSYTGQIHWLFTPHYGPYFQDWVDISLMVTYSVLGLHFARVLLRTKEYAPRLDAITKWLANSTPVGMILGGLLNSLMLSMVLAFFLNTTFGFLFIALGYHALRARVKLAVFFFISSVTAALCVCISTAAVAGILVPYNDVTFKLIEVGMAIEAMLLAVVLAYRFRVVQRGKETAEFHARTDELSKLNNRRGFREHADVMWQSLVEFERDVSIVLVDIDKFKQINDTFGHMNGDIVIKEVAQRISSIVRNTDICARWGGEEFILLLPETDREQARFHAERVRKSVESDAILCGDEKVSITVSLGVAGTQHGEFELAPLSFVEIEKMISHADQALYKAKNSGRNQVRVYAPNIQPTAM